MVLCECPDNRQDVPSDKRIYLIEPGAVRRDGGQVTKDMSKFHIHHADCPLHGYTDVTKESGSCTPRVS